MKSWLFALISGILGGCIVEFGEFHVLGLPFIILLLIGMVTYKFIGRFVGL